jgi:type I restriction enzyme M protein
MTGTGGDHLVGQATRVVRKLWQYCNVLRDDGLSYPDYVEQLTYLLFLKMADEQGDDGPVPTEYGWRSFGGLDATRMYRHYSQTLAALGECSGMLGLIFRNARNKIRDPAKLRLLVTDLIGQTQWSELSADVKGDAYEGLLEKNARDTKSGAGQYFTPRPLIDAIVRCVDPAPGEVVCDPACGTGGFLLAAHEHRCRKLSVKDGGRRCLQHGAVRGVELVEEVARLAAMNLLLHGVSAEWGEDLPIECADSLREVPKSRVDVVLTNPPFGMKGSVTYAKERRSGRMSDDLTIVRRDFWVQTANKQLNFLQHVVSLLKAGGRAAIVLPDNVLFEGGVASTIRRRLMECCDVHTLLRLPTGLFYAQGVKANVLFFSRLRPGESTGGLVWVYDLRAGQRFSLKTRPLQPEDLREFVESYCPGAWSERSEGASSRWRSFEQEALMKAEECSLNLTWAAEAGGTGAGDASRLDEIAGLIAQDLHRALTQIAKVRSPT